MEKVALNEETHFPWAIAQDCLSPVSPPKKIFKVDTSGVDLFTFSSVVSNFARTYENLTGWDEGWLRRTPITGSGCSKFEELAKLKSVAEAAERYASLILLEEEVIVETADAIARNAIDPTPLILSSRYETGSARWPITRFDPSAAMRWTKGWCVIEKREKYVPAVMSHLFQRVWPSERFWLPISTGTAAHTNILQASISAISEVIERDAIALNWLTARALPSISERELRNPECSYVLSESLRSDTDFTLLDATTDIGLPTVYTIESNRASSGFTNVVSCCSAFDWEQALSGSIRELSSTRRALEAIERPIPEQPEGCSTLEDGARYMASSKMAAVFDSVIAQSRVSMRQAYDNLRLITPKEQLAYLVAKVAGLSRDLVLLDLTTDDLAEAGLFVIRAVIPGLMPMSTDFNYRYLGHPRLHSYARQHVNPDFSLGDVNPWPQPFA